MYIHTTMCGAYQVRTVENCRHDSRGRELQRRSGGVTAARAGASSKRSMRAPGVRPTIRTVWLPAPRYSGTASFSTVQEPSGPSLEGRSVRSRMLASSTRMVKPPARWGCLLYTSDAADDLLCVDLGGRRIIKKKKKNRIKNA